MAPIDDDDAAGHGGGPLSYWLKYKVWGVPGWALALALIIAGWAVGRFV